MSSKQDSSSKMESFIYQRIQGPNNSFSVRQHKVVKKLGKGGFAQVYKIVRISDQKQFAIKVIKKDKGGGAKYDQNKILNEVNIMKKLKHPHIVQYQSHFQDQVDFNIIMELCQNGSFQQMLKKRQILTEPEVRYYLLQFISILKHLKTESVIHRDLKPANFFIDSKMNLKLGDFGLATLVDSHFLNSKRHTCGTPNYIAPQILCRQKYLYQIDVWSIGVLIYASLYGRPPFQTKEKKVEGTYEKIKLCQYTFPDQRNVSSEAKQLIKCILVSDFNKRITPDQILNHPFLTNYDIPSQLSCLYLQRPPESSFLQAYGKRKRNNKFQIRPLPTCQTISTEINSKISKQNQEQPELKKTEMKRYKPKYKINYNLCQNILKQQSIKTILTEVESQKRGFNNEQGSKTQKKDPKQIAYEIPIKVGLKQNTKTMFSNFRKNMYQNTKNESNQVINKKVIDVKNNQLILTQPKISNKSRVRQSFQPSKKRTLQLLSKQTVKVIDWIKCEIKHGIAYLLQNGFCGVLFNDSTRIISNWKLTDCIYQQFGQIFQLKVKGQTQSIDGSVDQINKVYKKIDILSYYLQKFKQKDAIHRYKLKVKDQTLQPDNLVSKYFQNSQTKIFIKNSGEIQCIFSDQSQIQINKKTLKLNYISQTGQKKETFIPCIQKSFAKQRIFKIKIKQVFKLLRSQNQIWNFFQKIREIKNNVKLNSCLKQNFQPTNTKKCYIKRQTLNQTKWGYEQVFNL